MALVTPIVNSIPAFDATETTPITFTADGGSEIFKNEIKIVNNATNVVVYTNIIITQALGQSVPANTLVNGTYYKVAFRTYDIYDNASEWSNYQPFYCYSTPTLSFNISDGDTLNTTSFDLKLTYNQAEDERLESAVIYFYDSADNLISTSGNLFNNNYPPIVFTYPLRSFENNKTYRVKADATTINGTPLTTGVISFSVSYQTVDNEGELFITVDSCNGYVNVRSAPVIDAVQGENRHNPAVLSYISDEMIDLTNVMGEIDTTNNYSSWIEWYDFSPVTNAFLFRLWFYPARVSFKIAEILSDDGSSRVTMTFRRGRTQDYIVVTSTDGTRISKELGTICNGNTKVFLWVKAVGNTWDVQTEILSSTETILDWNNTDNNISYNVTSDINYGNEDYGDYIPRRDVYHALNGSFNRMIVGNGIFDALDLSANINRPYSSEIPQHDISAVLFVSFNGSITNHAPTGYTRAMLQRKDSSMITWFDLTETDIDTSISTEIEYNDYLVPNGITQTYSLILYQGDIPSDAYTVDVVPKWGRVFLSDKDESYKLNYSVIYSNGSQNIQNGVLMPISATYPIVIQNAEGNYRSGSLQFKVLGYQFEIDKTLDRNSIVQQTKDILAFLTNGKIKCIKDYNGNIFICKVINSPQISYDANWGNGIATISFDWVEQAQYNKYDEMVEANIIDNTIVPPTPEPVPTPTTPIEPFIEKVYLPNGNSPDTIYPTEGIYAYTMYYGNNGTSSNTVNLYIPTNEYEIVSYKINNVSKVIPQIQESGEDLYYVLDFRNSSSTDDSAVVVTVRDNNDNEISYTFNFVCTSQSIYIKTSKYYVNSASAELITKFNIDDDNWDEIKFNKKYDGEAYRTTIYSYGEDGYECIGFLFISDNIESAKVIATATNCYNGNINPAVVIDTDSDSYNFMHHTCEFRDRTWYITGSMMFNNINYDDPNLTITPSNLTFTPSDIHLYDWSYYGLNFLQYIYGELDNYVTDSVFYTNDNSVVNIFRDGAYLKYTRNTNGEAYMSILYYYDSVYQLYKLQPMIVSEVANDVSFTYDVYDYENVLIYTEQCTYQEQYSYTDEKGRTWYVSLAPATIVPNTIDTDVIIDNPNIIFMPDEYAGSDITSIVFYFLGHIYGFLDNNGYGGTIPATPNGKTVYEEDNLQIWLRCANIWGIDANNYYLDDILKWGFIRWALVNSTNASNYLVRSYYYFSYDMMDDYYAMRDIGRNNYCSDLLLANEYWRESICNADYYYMILNTSNPIMTSNTTPSGICSCYPDNNNDAWKGFDGSNTIQNDNVGIVAARLTDSESYIQYEFATTQNVYKVKVEAVASIPSPSATYTYPNDIICKIQGSSDGVYWYDLDTTDDFHNHSSVYDFEKAVYKYFRVWFNKAVLIINYNSQTYYATIIGEVQINGRNDVDPLNPPPVPPPPASYEFKNYAKFNGTGLVTSYPINEDTSVDVSFYEGTARNEYIVGHTGMGGIMSLGISVANTTNFTAGDGTTSPAPSVKTWTAGSHRFYSNQLDGSSYENSLDGWTAGSYYPTAYPNVYLTVGCMNTSTTYPYYGYIEWFEVYDSHNQYFRNLLHKLTPCIKTVGSTETHGLYDEVDEIFYPVPNMQCVDSIT